MFLLFHVIFIYVLVLLKAGLPKTNSEGWIRVEPTIPRQTREKYEKKKIKPAKLQGLIHIVILQIKFLCVYFTMSYIEKLLN